MGTISIIDKSILGVAGEFAVASELCRRNVYAQLTLGNQKRVDLLTLGNDGTFCTIEVKAKQGKTWGNVKGICSKSAFLVFVDFYNKEVNQRPDFYVLSSDDWREYAQTHVDKYNANEKHVNHEKPAYVDANNCPVFPIEKTKSGQPYRGCSVYSKLITNYKDAWEKILNASGPLSNCPPDIDQIQHS